MKEKMRENLFSLISRSIWQTGTADYVDWPLFEKMKQHSIAALPLTVPYVILKGTAAAKYYPNPALRGMGDIDRPSDRRDTLGCVQRIHTPD